MNTENCHCGYCRGDKFRFLYGRWIHRPKSRPTVHLDVQIPLWSMNTRSQPVSLLHRIRVQIPLWSMNTAIKGASNIADQCVQIPLWSMNTGTIAVDPAIIPLFRFLYGRWIPVEAESVIGRLAGSDSSMVDEYASEKQFENKVKGVQIPLWSMNTYNWWPCKWSYKAFRFLYGRWIRSSSCINSVTSSRSDSSMVDEYS